MISFQEIIFGAVLALILTWLIVAVRKMFKIVITGGAELSYRPKELGVVMLRCYALFPIDMLHFKDEYFYRGMGVRVKTTAAKTIEGKFIGLNDENLACFITPGFVIAQEVKEIQEIVPIG